MAREVLVVICAGALAQVQMVGSVSSVKAEEFNDAYRVVDVGSVYALAAMGMEFFDVVIVVVLEVANAISAMVKVSVFALSVMENKMYMVHAQNVMAMAK